MKRINLIIILIIINWTINAGCLESNKNGDDNDHGDNNTEELTEYAEYTIKINAHENYSIKIPFLSVENINLDILIKEIEIIEGTVLYSIVKINYSDVLYGNITELMKKYMDEPKTYPQFSHNDKSLLIQGNGIAELYYKINGKFIGDLTLRNDINSGLYWFYLLSENNENISIQIKATIETDHSGEYWNRYESNYTLINGWQMIQIKNVGWIV